MRKVLIILLLLGLSTAMMAQSPLAASVEATFSGVEVKLNNTDEWLPLADGSNTPLGAGDSVRTDSSGRAILRFLENSTVLLLPETSYTLIEFSQSPTSLLLHAEIEGIAIQQVTGISDFELHTTQLVVDSAEGAFGIWSKSTTPDEDTVIVAEGQVTVNEVLVEAGNGLMAHDEMRVVAMSAPYNQARLIAVLDGCIGIVQTRAGTRGVLARTGAGTGYQRRGLIGDSGQLPLLGATESTGWTRIQFLNGFGWVVSNAVTSDCDLPSLPDDSPEESIIQVTNADEFELAMLRPFYGNPLLDAWFYNIVVESD
ncbi:MAG: hypothetical protein Q9P44_09360 [Anaerolineae bacterium]|nr:hypothetical protein [Anaerolineae bacterium]